MKLASLVRSANGTRRIILGYCLMGTLGFAYVIFGLLFKIAKYLLSKMEVK